MNLVLSGLTLPLAHFTLNVDLTFDGKVTGVFGPSGSGKTTLLEIIAGLRRPSHGQIAIGNHVVTDTARRLFVPPERRGIGYLPQEGALFPHLSVRDNLRYGYRCRGSSALGPTPVHVAAILEIEGLEDRSVPTLSGGEQRRVALARALLAAPQLLLLDEPLAGLDAPLRDRLMPYLQHIRDEFGIPMVYVTHAPEEVMHLCDHVVVLAGGKVEVRGNPAELFEASRPSFQRKGLDGASDHGPAVNSR